MYATRTPVVYSQTLLVQTAISSVDPGCMKVRSAHVADDLIEVVLPVCSSMLLIKSAAMSLNMCMEGETDIIKVFIK